MAVWIEATTRALADRKGATAIEYAVVATGAATVVAACYRAFFTRVVEMLGTISFLNS